MSASYLATADLIELLVGQKAVDVNIEIAMKKLKLDPYDVMWEEVKESLFVCETCENWGIILNGECICEVCGRRIL